MRGHLQSSTRRLNKHWQSGGNGGGVTPRPITRFRYVNDGSSWYNTWNNRYTNPPDYDQRLNLWKFQPIIKIPAATVNEIIANPSTTRYLRFRVSGNDMAFWPNGQYSRDWSFSVAYRGQTQMAFPYFGHSNWLDSYSHQTGVLSNVEYYTSSPTVPNPTTTIAQLYNGVTDILLDLSACFAAHASDFTGKDLYISAIYKVNPVIPSVPTPVFNSENFGLLSLELI